MSSFFGFINFLVLLFLIIFLFAEIYLNLFKKEKRRTARENKWRYRRNKRNRGYKYQRYHYINKNLNKLDKPISRQLKRRIWFWKMKKEKKRLEEKKNF